jgi:LemA protein
MSMRISSGAEIVSAAPTSLTLPHKGGRRDGGAAALLRRLLLLLLVGLPLAGCGVNNIPSYSEQAKAAWAQVLNQYQRRADLVPNLVATVKGAANFESKTLEAVVEARAKVGQMQLPPDILTNPQAFQTFQQNQGALTSALSRLMVVVEQYPELKANANFQTLQAQLEGTENRIAVARRDYIQAVQKYNTELVTFPGRIWAMLLYSSYKEMAQFTADEKAMTAPTVNFN